MTHEPKIIIAVFLFIGAIFFILHRAPEMIIFLIIGIILFAVWDEKKNSNNIF